MKSTSQPETTPSPLDAEFSPPQGKFGVPPAQTKRSFTSLVFLTSGTSLAIGGLGLITGALAARLLGPEGRGELAAIQTWPSCVATIAAVGFPEALVYFSSRRRKEAAGYFVSGTVFLLLVSWIFVAIGLLGVPLLLGQYSPEVRFGARCYLWFLPVSVLLGFGLSAFRSANMVRWNMLRVMPTFGWLVVLISARFLHQRTALTLGIEFLGSIGAVCLLVCFQLVRRLEGSWRASVTKAKELLHFGLPSVMTTVPQVVNMRLDQMLMAAFLPATSLGLYVVAVAWGNIPAPVLSGLSAVLFPHVAGLEGIEQQRRAFASVTRVAVIVCLVIGVALAAVTPFLLPLVFGRAFAPVVPTALILIAAALVTAFNTIVEDGLRGFGRPKAVMCSELGGVVVTVILLVALLPRWGVIGAAVSAFCGYSTVLLLLLVQARRITGLSYGAILRPRTGDLLQVGQRVRGILQKRQARGNDEKRSR